jgi:hypothetical protein
MEASKAESRGYLDTGQVTPAEFVGMAAGALLVLSLFLPWFSTSDNPNSIIGETGDLVIGPNDSASAWDTYGVLKFLLIAGAAAPFILTWIIARGHKLTWKPGEVTMVVGITAFVLILCNGIILGRPDPGIEISLSYGYLIGLIACVGMTISGYLRQSVYTEGRKPPGVI